MILQGTKTLISTAMIFLFYNAEPTDINILLLGALLLYVFVASMKFIILMNE